MAEQQASLDLGGFSYVDRPGEYSVIVDVRARIRLCIEAQSPAEAAIKAEDLVQAEGYDLGPEEIALWLNVDLLSIRPRCSELFAKGKIKKTGQTRMSRGGKRAIVWELA